MKCIITRQDPADKHKALIVRHGRQQTPWGTALLAWTEEGLCCLSFDADPAMLQRRWPHFHYTEAPEEGPRYLPRILSVCEDEEELPLHLIGTDFQILVWRALLNIQAGETVSYKDIANEIGNPQASRAVGQAVGQNPLAILIPCHRVLPAIGGIGNYAWGSPLKQKLLESEVVL